MRILYHCNGFLLSTIGGVEVLSYHFLNALRRRGHDILMVTGRVGSDPPGPQKFDDLDLVRLDFGQAVASRDLFTLRRMKASVDELVTSFRPDVIHVNDTMVGTFCFLRGGATTHLPHVLTIHSPIRPAGKDGLQVRLAADADRIITVSQAQYADAAATMPALLSKMSTILNALPMPDLRPTELPFAPPVVLCIGRLVPDKGFDLAIRACARLRDRGVVVKMIVAGDGHEQGALAALAQELGLAGQIEFPGWVSPDRVGALMNSATMVVVPSRWPEPFGLVALQAAQMGRPVIANAVGGLPEVVEHGVTGLVVAPEDEQAIADAVERVLSDSRSARRMGENARARALHTFSFDVFVDAYERVFADVIEVASTERTMVG